MQYSLVIVTTHLRLSFITSLLLLLSSIPPIDSKQNIRRTTFTKVEVDGGTNIDDNNGEVVKVMMDCARSCAGNDDCLRIHMNSGGSGCHQDGGQLKAGDPPEGSLVFTRSGDLNQANCLEFPYFIQLQGVLPSDQFCFGVFNNASYSYQSALDYCHQLGAPGLLYLDTSVKFNALFEYIRAQNIATDLWIGANDIAVEGQWVHELNGLPVNATLFSWLTYPIRDNDDCALIDVSKDYVVKDQKCDRQDKGFVCEVLL